MKIIIPVDSGTATGILVRSGWVTIPALVLFGLFAVPLGMTYVHYIVVMPLLIFTAISLVGIGLFANEHGRLAFVPFRDGADDTVAECWPAMVSQTCAIAVAIGAPLLALLIVTGHTAI